MLCFTCISRILLVVTVGPLSQAEGFLGGIIFWGLFWGIVLVTQTSRILLVVIGTVQQKRRPLWATQQLGVRPEEAAGRPMPPLRRGRGRGRGDSHRVGAGVGEGQPVAIAQLWQQMVLQ
jgi:hypothetical protein